MKKLFTLLLLLLPSFFFAQVQNDKYLSFDGTDDVVGTTANPSLNLTSFTIEFWAKFDREVNTPTGNSESVFIISSASKNIFEVSFQQYQPTGFPYPSRLLRMIIYDSNNSPFFAESKNLFIPSDPSAGNYVNSTFFNHYAITFDDNSQEVKLLLNGVVVFTEMTSGLNLPSTTDPKLTIGESSSYPPFFKGGINELRIWNTVRTPTQIANNRDNYLAGNETGLVSYFRFDETNSACEVVDAASGKHGVRSGASGTNNLPQYVAHATKPNVPYQTMHWATCQPCTNPIISVPPLPAFCPPFDVATIPVIDAANVTGNLTFFSTQADATNNVNPLSSTVFTTAGTSTIWVRKTNAANNICFGITSFPLTIKAKPNLGPDVNLSCSGGSTPSTHNFALAGLWRVLSQPPTASATILPIGLASNMTIAGLYSFEVDVNGCKDEANVSVPTDITNPILTSCSGNITITSSDICSIAVWTAPTASDNCSTPTVTSNFPSGTCFSRGSTNTVTYTATDASNNSSTCSFIVRLINPLDNGTGNAAVFDGTTSYIESAEGERGNDQEMGGLNLNVSSFTMETWIKFNNPATGTTDWIAEIGSSPNGVNTWFWFNNANQWNFGYNKLHIGFAGSSGGSIPTGGTTGGGDFTYDFTPTQGQWYHLAYTYNSSTKKLNLFVNGVAQGEKTNTGNAVPTFVSRPKLQLGKRIFGGVTSHFLEGAMDEFRLWNYAKTVSQIQAQYQTELSGNEAGLVVYYKFDEPGPTVCDVSDCTPNRFDATHITTRVVSNVPNLTDMACGADPSVSGYKEFVGRLNGGCGNTWNNANNWSPVGVPTASDNVLIRHGQVAIPNGTASLVINSLTLDGAKAGIFNSGSPQPLEMQNLIWKSGEIGSYIKTFGAGSEISNTNIAKRYYNASWSQNGTVNFSGWSQYGTVTWSGGSINMSSCSINNELGGVFERTGNTWYGFNRGGTNPRAFYNHGTFNLRNSPTYACHLFGNSLFYNSGTYNQELACAGVDNLSNIGNFTLAANKFIDVGNSYFSNTSNFSGTGRLNLHNNCNIDGIVNTKDIRLELYGDPATNAINGINSPLLTGKRVDFFSKKINIPMTIQAGGILNLMSNAWDKILASTITNNGTSNWIGGNVKFQNGILANKGTFNINLASAGMMSEVSGTNKFENCGTVYIAPTSQSPIINVPRTACSTGEQPIVTGVGVLNLLTDFDANGVLFRFGGSPGKLVINPSVTAGPLTVFEMEITGGYGAPGIADDYDKLESAGNIVLDGTMKLILNNPAVGVYPIFESIGTPPAGVTYTVSKRPTFNVLYSVNGSPFLPTPPAGLNIIYNARNVEVNISQLLPIELLSFKAKNTEGGNLLTWQTASEINTSHFDIERSNDGIKFNKIGELKAQNKAANYTYLDKAPFGGWGVYYRLTINDLDGKTNVSKIVSIENKSDKNIKITRNTEGSILIETNNLIELITITNSIGQVIKSTKDNPFLINDLNAGIYIISVKTDKGFLSQKIFKQ